ncbi:MAG: TolC family protein [Nitrospirae bacterium]|nr:TolC family protein [Nitrospirota bacterium]
MTIWLVCLSVIPASAQQTWTLDLTVKRALEAAPELRASEAEVRAREGMLQQAGAWPNPEFEVGADNHLGKEDGRAGQALTGLAFSQSLPVSGRLGHERKNATAELARAEAEYLDQVLQVEYRAARTFHALQLARETLILAESRLQAADEFQRIGVRRERAGDLARLERLRLDIIRESAQQAVATAEGEYSEALADFQVYMGIPDVPAPEPVRLTLPELPQPLDALLGGLVSHPRLSAARHRISAAQATVNLARASRFADPQLRVFRERDFLGNRRQEVTGAGVSLPLPLWDRKSGLIRATLEGAEQARSQLQGLQRDLDSRVRLSHLHLGHLIAQAKDYRTRILGPAEEMFSMTRKGYAAGEVEILGLIDANDIHFDAHTRYLELLQEAWLEVAELRLVSGQSLTAPAQTTIQGTQP